MAAAMPQITAEDIQNIPRILKNLDVQGLFDTSCLSLKERCYQCITQGTGDPEHREYRHLHTRRGTFHGKGFNGSTPQELAECGLFVTGTGRLTCYQCGQILRLLVGEDPLAKHADIYPNCKHVCKVLRKRPKSVISALTTSSVPCMSGRRRLFSE